MSAFLLLSLPIFAVIGVGWLAVRLAWFEETTLATLSEFSFRIALPALVLRTIASQPLAQSFHIDFFIGLLSVGLICFAITLASSKGAMKCSLGAAAAFGTTATVSNLGFLGLPLLLALFGDRGAGPLAMAIMSEVGVVMALGIALIGWTGRDTKQPGNVFAPVLQVTLFNPVILAIGIGVAFAATSYKIVAPLDRLLGFIGAAAGPVSLFALGGTMAGRTLKGDLAVGLFLTVMKLVAYPLLTFVMLNYVLTLDHFWVSAGVLIASLPTAGNVFVIAQRAGSDPEKISTAIILSTLLSALSFPIVAWLVLG